MKVKAHVLSLTDHGTEVIVTAQGFGVKDAQWRPWQLWEFKVPDYVGRRWKIGTKIEITVKAIS